MAERYSSVPLTLAFQERANAELTVLNSKLHDQLRQDLTRIYKESLFADLDILFNCGRIRTHKSLLKTRAPRFYSELCLSQYKNGESPVLSKINRHFIESFIREIYNENVLKHKEDAVVAQIKRINYLKDTDPGSPESDVFLTPKSSPIEAPQTYIEGGCNFQKTNAHRSDSLRTEALENLHKTNSLYYSLVHVEDDLNSSTADKSNVLEKELAEQDELFKSFQSIIFKEGKTKVKKPFSLSINNNKKIKNKSFIDCEKTDKLKYSSRLCKIGFQDVPKTLKTSHSFIEPRQTKTAIKNQCLLKKFGPRNYSAFHVENACQALDEMNNKKCFLDKREHEEVMSNPENDLGGQDSCLEAGSSGYITGGGSPKDITGSEGFGIDITEVASGEEIPHDNERFPVSSSASSDAGTWDSTFHTNEEPTFVENFNASKYPTEEKGNMTSLEPNANENVKISEKVVSPTVPEYLGSAEEKGCRKYNTNDSNLGEIKKTSYEKLNLNDDDTTVYSGIPSYDLLALNNTSDYYNENYTKSIDERALKESEEKLQKKVILEALNQVHTVNFKVGDVVKNNAVPIGNVANDPILKNYCQVINTNISTEENTSPRTNYFIDAATLLDENEISLNSQSMNAGFSVESNEQILCGTENFNDLNPTTDIKASLVDSRDTVNSDGLPSLIRRNTFELNPDDDKLALLRQEYERRQGSILFNSSSSSENSGINASTEEIKCKSPKPEHPDSLFISQPEPFIPAAENDVHSPDSLNNDSHINTFSEEKTSHYKDICANDENVIASLNHDFSMTSAPHPYGGITYPDQDFSEPPSIENKELNTDKPHFNSNQYDSFNKFESTPIVSGGTLITDIATTEVTTSLSSSPMTTRRKTEFAPILSGGLNIPPEVDVKSQPGKTTSPLARSWIVDMSDSGKSSLASQSSKSNSEKNKGTNSGLGFFVPLDDPLSSLDNFPSSADESMPTRNEGAYNDDNKPEQSSSSCGFFIDLKSDLPETQDDIKMQAAEKDVPEKKLFTMFIDIGDSCSKSSDTNSPKSRNGSPFLANKKIRPKNHTDRFRNGDKNLSTSSDSSVDICEHPEVAKGKLLFSDESLHNSSQQLSESSSQEAANKKQSFFMFIEANTSPLPKKRNMPLNLRPSSQRHSWNVDYKKHSPEMQQPLLKREHKRANSVSIEKANFNSNPFLDDRFQSGPASFEETGIKLRETKPMMSSWHGPVKPSTELCRIIANGKYDTKDCKNHSTHSENENPDKFEDLSCSIKSDDVYDTSNATNVSSKDDKNRTFILDDVSKVVHANTNDLELSTPSHDIVSDLSKDDTETDPVKEQLSSGSNTTNRSDLSIGGNDQNEATPKIHENSSCQPEPRLDSLGFVKLSDMDKEPVKVWTNASEKKTSRMSRSIPEGSWLEEKMMTQSATSRSLSRLFPHLYPRKTPEPDDLEIQSSTHSSMQSSFEPSGLDCSTEGTEVSSASGGPCSRLGEDLLRMFIEEISPDVTVEVGGRRIKAHKCILSSRCQYFAGILSGGWVESAGNVISLQGFSYNTVHFALCHIYSGASNVPETINIVELATLADMLCLEGLKEVITYTLKVKYCHFFHKPCGTCTVGVLECLPLAAAYGLDEIYRKSLRWITRHFVRVWPTKEFSTLPKELQDKCYKQHIIHMSAENVLDTVMGCDKLEATIPNVRWAQPVFALNSKLHDAAVKFLSQHFNAVIASDTFLSIGKEDAWTVGRIEGTLLATAHTLSPEQACLSYGKLRNIITVISTASSSVEWKPEFVDLLCKLDTNVEDCLVRQAGRAARTSAWSLLELPLRRKIQESACLVFLPGDEKRRGRHSSINKRAETSKIHSDDTHQPKPKTSDASSSKESSAVQSKGANQNPVAPRSKKLSQVKSRYLEPKPVRKEPSSTEVSKVNSTFGQRRVPPGKPLISSSDSSRTSSPATTRALVTRTRQRTKDSDRLTMSTDSLCESKPNPPMKSCSTKSVPENRPQHTPIPTRKSLPARTETFKLRSSESIPEKNSTLTQSQPLSKARNATLSSTSKKVEGEGSPSMRLRSNISTPSPSMKRNSTPAQNSNKAPDTKRAPLNRTSTYRVSQKPMSPSRTSTSAKESTYVNTKARGNLNKEQKTNCVGKSIINNNSSLLMNGKSNNTATKSKTLSVGSRSGTFLKDEPTVLKKPDRVIE